MIPISLNTRPTVMEAQLCWMDNLLGNTIVSRPREPLFYVRA